VHGEEAIILPCLGRSDKDVLNEEEQFVSCENSMGVVQMSKGKLKPVSSNLLSEPTIVCRLAKATLGNKSVIDWSRYENHYDVIREDIAKTIAGFDKYNEQVRKLGGFYLPNAARYGEYKTLSGKAHFTSSQATDHALADNEYMMMTIRSHDQFNTTIYGLNDRYRGVLNERRVIFMNAGDISKEGLKQGDLVDLYNHHNQVERIARKFVVVSFNIPQQCTATYFPETNVLVPIDSTAEKSNTPTSKTVVITVKKHSPSI
jgi:anaerobic selenocysteine-containing dehydrogenase